MNVGNATPTQLLVAWRGNRWIVSRDNVEAGAYAYRAHAIERAQALAIDEHAAGRECYMLIREKNGSWIERPCPKPSRRRVARPLSKD